MFRIELLFQILELLWDLSHLPSLPTSLLEQALDEHLNILLHNDTAIKEQVKRTYVTKCVSDIKEVRLIFNDYAI